MSVLRYWIQANGGSPEPPWQVMDKLELDSSGRPKPIGQFWTEAHARLFVEALLRAEAERSAGP